MSEAPGSAVPGSEQPKTSALPGDALAPRVPSPFAAGALGPGASTHDVALELRTLADRAAGYAANASGPGTQVAYRSAWRAYTAWCASVGQNPLAGDPGLLALYLTRRAEDGLAVSSLRVARAAIRAAHALAGVPLDGDDPRLTMVMEGIVRSRKARPKRQAAPAVPDVLKKLLAALPSTASPAAAVPALTARHRAMLLIGFGAALRRSELVALRVGDVSVVDGRGLQILVRHSKTDQHGAGRTLAIWGNVADPAFCPVAAFEAWMAFRAPAGIEADAPPLRSPQAASSARSAADHTGPTDGLPLFCGISSAGNLSGVAMADRVVARLMKQACVLAGIAPERFSGHSLRRGLLTAAGDLQLPLIDLMRQSRHVSVQTAMSYVEAGDAWRNNITAAVFTGRAQSEARSLFEVRQIAIEGQRTTVIGPLTRA